MPKRDIIFVGGIHGVGKSSFCSKLARVMNLPHCSAGELIKRHRENHSQRDKRVSDVSENQDVLVQAVESLPFRNSSLLLDGHFCVLGSSEQVIRIPLLTFQQLAPIAALVLHDVVETIQQRLRARDREGYSTELLRAFQKVEVAHAQEVCASLGITLRLLLPEMLSEATEFVAQQIATKTR